MTSKLVLPMANIVGESAVWDQRDMRLVWVDIVGKTIHAFAPDGGEVIDWNAPDLVTSIGLRKDGGAIVGLSKQLCLWDYDECFRPVVDVEPDIVDNRLNEGVVGPDGAYWIGTMQNNIDADGNALDITENSGQLHRYAPDGTLTRICDDLFGITNTFVWPDERSLIIADTLKNEIYRYAIATDARVIAGRELILGGFERGLPDGSCIDAEGYIWNCRVAGGGCLVRLSATGEIERIVELPCSWPTSCAFGGEDLATLFVTSARFTMSAEHLAANPQEGGLFALDVGVRGLPPFRFG